MSDTSAEPDWLYNKSLVLLVSNLRWICKRCGFHYTWKPQWRCEQSLNLTSLLTSIFLRLQHSNLYCLCFTFILLSPIDCNHCCFHPQFQNLHLPWQVITSYVQKYIVVWKDNMFVIDMSVPSKCTEVPLQIEKLINQFIHIAHKYLQFCKVNTFTVLSVLSSARNPVPLFQSYACIKTFQFRKNTVS